MMLYVSAAINLDFDSFFRYFAADMLEKLEKLNVREEMLGRKSLGTYRQSEIRMLN